MAWWPLMLLVAALLAVVIIALLRPQSGKPVRDNLPDFDVHVINLDTMPHKMAAFVERLQSTDLAGVGPIRFGAVDGKLLRIEDEVTEGALREIETAERTGYRERHYELTRGAVGCYLSHMAIWERLLQSDKHIAMVCEDDAKLDTKVLQTLQQARANIPDNWDILLLGYWCVKCATLPTHKFLKRFFGLHCYLIKGTAVPKIREYSGHRIAQQIDSMLSDMCNEGKLTVYGLPEKVAFQLGQDTSTVQMPLNHQEDRKDPWMTLPVAMQSRA